MRRLSFSIATIVFMAIFAVAGCSSNDPNTRRQRLLEIYPPGQTSRADVQRKWAPIPPELTAQRPASGWASLDNPRIRERVAASENRTGNTVERVDCYLGADGAFGLCNCWFYYDKADMMVDVEWQHHTD
jgi:hypothetical protein